MGAKLDVIGAVGDAFAALAHNLGAAVRLALPWMLLVGAITYFSLVSSASSISALPSTVPEAALWQEAVQGFVQLFAFVAGCIVAVAWHRRILLGEQAMTALPSSFTLRYIGITLLMVLAIFVPIMLFGLLTVAAAAAFGPWIGALMLFVPLVAALVAALRLSLVLPARAIGDTGLRLRDSWALTTGNTWRLIGGTILSAVIPAIVLNLAIMPFMFGGMPEMDPKKPNLDLLSAWMQSLALPSALIAMGYMIVSMIGIGFLSYAYRHFRGSQAPAA